MRQNFISSKKNCAWKTCSCLRTSWQHVQATGGKCKSRASENDRLAMETYVEDGNFVYALALSIRLRGKILVDILEVRDGDILLEFLVEDDVIVNELDLPCEIVEGTSATRGLISLFSASLFGHRVMLNFWCRNFLLWYFKSISFLSLK